MKKVLMFLVLFLFPFCVSAQEYSIDDINLKISFDDNWYVFTRDNIKDNEILKEYNVTEEYMNNMFKVNKAYINAVPQDFSLEFFAIVIDTGEINNLANYPDKMIEKDIADGIKQKLTNSKDIETSIITVNNYKYLKVSFYDTSVKKYIYKYYTVINRKGYNFQIQKDTKLNTDDEKVLDKIVESIDIKVLNPKENSKMQKEIDKYNNKGNIWSKVLIGAIIGAIIGAVISIINNKKKN